MTTTVEHLPRPYDALDVSSLAFWSQRPEDREDTFRRLRDESPVSWQPPVEGGLMTPENAGFWAVTRHEHVVEASLRPADFCSGEGIQFEEVPQDILEAASSFLAMDGAKHLILRRLMSSAFTPRRVKLLEDQIRAQAARIVDDLLDHSSGDFVRQVSMRLPMWTIYQMLGLPEEYREEAAHNADGMVSWADPDVAQGREPGQVLSDSLVGLLTMGMDFAEQTRKNPGTDIWSNLVTAEVDGQRLTDEELGSFFVLLSVAGNDTTRNSISIVAKAFSDFPDQRELLVADFPGRIDTALDEFVRWATPVMTFRRTTTHDTELGGQRIAAGEWIAMFYSSANRDERAFSNPDTFDITRSPNKHVGFGGGGPHYCMGSFLAKIQLRHIFDQLLHRAPTLTLGEPSYLVGNFVNAIKSMPFSL